MKFLCLNLYLLCLNYLFCKTSGERISYMIHERPVVTYINKSYVKEFLINSRRHTYDRKDPRYYINVYIESLVPATNDLKIDMYFYQFFTNRYSPSFVNMHFRFCDMLEKDPFMGAQLRRHLKLLKVKCPYPPGKYNLTDMVAPYVPKNFPFTKGRIYTNFTLLVNGVPTQAGQGYVDMEIKEMTVNKRIGSYSVFYL